MNSIGLTKNSVIEVSTGQVKAAKAPGSLECLALGSCVAVIIYDQKNKIGGIAHVMLPSESHSAQEHESDLLKHADRAIPELLKQIRELGADEKGLIARLAGGALVIPDTPDIGSENIEAVRRILQERSIKIIDEHIGGTAGRSVLFDLGTGELRINGRIMPAETLTTPSPFFIREKHTLPDQAGENIESVESHSEYIANLEKKVAERTRELSERVEELNNVRKATFNLLEDLEKERDNITEAKAIEEQLLQHLPVGVFMVEADTGKVLIINPRGVELLGRGVLPEAGPGSYASVYDILKEDGTPYPADELPINIVLREKREVVKDDIIVRKPNGEKTNLRVVGTPISDIRGKLRFGIAVFDDITREKEVDKAKSEFVSLASHQLRTPLTAISWYTEMLLTGDVGEVVPGQRKYLEEIQEGNARMIELVNTLLDVSRIELGTLLAEPKPTDVIALAESVLDEQKVNIQSKQLTIVRNLSENIPMFLIDPKLLRMVFQNLLSNAVEYTPANGRIEFAVSVDSKHNICIKISDTGYGIPKALQDIKFTQLFRADNVRDKDTNGTGLGLYIVKSIVENSGGKIWFESKENEGTAFFIEFPLHSKEGKHAK